MPASTKFNPKLSPQKLAFVTDRLYGWDESTENSQGIFALAQSAASAGNSVSILWCPDSATRSRVSAEHLDSLVDGFYENHLIRLVMIDRGDELLPRLDFAEKRSVAIRQHILSEDYHAVFFACEGGLGYYSILGKECGLEPVRTSLQIVVAEPVEWLLQADRDFPGSTRQLAQAHMERYCIEHADQVICSSQYMANWMRDSGWTINGKLFLIPMPLPYDQYVAEPDRPEKTGSVRDLVFINSHGDRHGFSLFCDLVSRLSSSREEITINILGYFSKIAGEHSGGMVLKNASNWPFPIRFYPRFSEDDIRRFITHRNCLVVFSDKAANQPAMVKYCIAAGVPFVATDVGGIDELLQNTSRKQLLSKPDAKRLAALLSRRIKNPLCAVAAAGQTNEDWRERWLRYLQTERWLVRSERKNHGGVNALSKRPLVSIVIAHHDRPVLLRQAVDSIIAQDYSNIELIIVDDGSEDERSHQALDQLEFEFRRRKGWTILRQPNRYLGVARNTGIKASKGEYVLFVDDDNALFRKAVSTFVHAMESSGADVCATFSKLLYDPVIPKSEKLGFIQYFPLGGSLDLALFHNSMGDANAMIRRTVFDKIGYLVEDYGFTAQDWEFFTRAVFEGLKLRIIPEPLYWYRSSPTSMFRNSNWVENRLPVLELYRQHGFRGAELAIQMCVGQNVANSDKNIQFENLWFSVDGERYRRLAELEPNSDDAIRLLAEIATLENRQDTSLALLAELYEGEDFIDRVRSSLYLKPPVEKASSLFDRNFTEKMSIELDQLGQFEVFDSTSGQKTAFYIDGNSRLVIETKGEQIVHAILKGGIPSGSVRISVEAVLFDKLAVPAEVLIAMVPSGIDPEQFLKCPNTEGCSDWVSVSRPFSPRQLTAVSARPTSAVGNLLLAVRCRFGAQQGVSLVSFSSFQLSVGVPAEAIRRPKLGAPAYRQQSFSLDTKEFNATSLLTRYKSELPMLMVDRKGRGLFMRPHQKGPVIARIPHIFPPFAKRVIASVEIAHEDASDFEFLAALAREDLVYNPNAEIVDQCLTSSGWVRVTNRFSVNELVVETETRMKAYLDLVLGIRLPRHSRPDPANTFFRAITVSWIE